MATRTGRLVMDMKTGKIVDEVKEDQILVALYDPACGTNVQSLAFQPILRSNFTVYVCALCIARRLEHESPIDVHSHTRVCLLIQQEDQCALWLQRCAAQGSIRKYAHDAIARCL